MNQKTCIALLLPGLLAACALEPKRMESLPETRIVVQPAPPSEADQLLNHVARMRMLDARDFAAERDNAHRQFLQERSDFNRVNYALMLALSPGTTSFVSASAVQDDAELGSLIEPLLGGAGATSTPAGPELRALAGLLQSVVSERRKMREQLRDAQARLAMAKKDDPREAENRALRARVDELETRLNALKSIDRSVNRRAESTGK